MRYAFYTYKSVEEKWDTAWGGDSVRRHLKTIPRFPQLISLFENHLTPKSEVLEAGCGMGRWIVYLRERGHNVIGIDYSRNAVTSIKEYDGSIRLNLGDVMDLPYKDDTFDVYLSFGVIEHVEVNREQILKEAYRVLRPGGLLIVSVPLVNNLARLLWSLNKIRFQGLTENYFFEEAMSEGMLKHLLAQNGFEVIDATVYGHFSTLYSLVPFLRKDRRQKAEHLGEFNTLGEKLNDFVTNMQDDSFLSRQIAHMITCVGRSKKVGE
jgi:SAM-dependent methyltransferase